MPNLPRARECPKCHCVTLMSENYCTRCGYQFVLSPAMAASDVERVSQCSECRHVFSAKDLADEDKSSWGHPCYGMKRKGVCESFRHERVLVDDKG